MSNILPLQQKKDIKKMKYLRFCTVGVVCGSIITCIVLALCILSLMILRTERNLLNIQIHTARNSTEAQEVDTIITDNTKKIGDIERAVIAKDTTSLYDTMQTIINTPQPGIKVSTVSFAIESHTIHIEGIAQDRETLEVFTGYLRTLAGVTGVDSPLSNFIKSKQSPFSLTVSF